MSTHASKPVSLTADLIAVKGQATVLTATAPESSGPVRSMSFKVDDARYRQLKRLGVDRGKTSQDLLSEALDMLLRGAP